MRRLMDNNKMISNVNFGHQHVKKLSFDFLDRGQTLELELELDGMIGKGCKLNVVEDQLEVSYLKWWPIQRSNTAGFKPVIANTIIQLPFPVETDIYVKSEIGVVEVMMKKSNTQLQHFGKTG